MANRYGWATPPASVSNGYIEKCRLFGADDNEFDKFRQDADYTKILEGKDKIIGDISLKRIFDMYKDDIELIVDKLPKFKENDIFGTPTIHNYETVGDMAPATIKYICNALDIKSIVKDKKLRKTVEIGGGFGGLCKTISVLYDFDEYVQIDLPEVISLCKKYLNHFDDIINKVTFITTEEFEHIDKIDNVDLFIADSSLAECDVETQNKYIDKILKNSQFAYIVYNTMHVNGVEENYNNMLNKFCDDFDVIVNDFGGVLFMFMRRKGL